jgi:hypothetical protein
MRRGIARRQRSGDRRQPMGESHKHEAKEWQAAMEALILVATHGGPTMLAGIAVMRALNRHVERVIKPSRESTH